MAELIHHGEADVERLSAEVASLRQENATLHEEHEEHEEHKEHGGSEGQEHAHHPASRGARVAVRTMLGLLLSFSAVMVFLSVMPLD